MNLIPSSSKGSITIVQKCVTDEKMPSEFGWQSINPTSQIRMTLRAWVSRSWWPSKHLCPRKQALAWACQLYNDAIVYPIHSSELRGRIEQVAVITWWPRLVTVGGPVGCDVVSFGQVQSASGTFVRNHFVAKCQCFLNLAPGNIRDCVRHSHPLELPLTALAIAGNGA